jgi:hypothetical protein
LRTNPCHRACIPYPSGWCLRLLFIDQRVQTSGGSFHRLRQRNFILQVGVSVFCCPFTGTSIQMVDAGMQDILPLFLVSRHCVLVRPGTSVATATQFLPCVCTASFSLMSSSSNHFLLCALSQPMLGSTFFHLSRHCVLDRPGTSVATANQFLPCVCTASFSLMSSSANHLPLCTLSQPMLGSKLAWHLL